MKTPMRLALAALIWTSGAAMSGAPALAANPTPEQCAAAYASCDASCQRADPKHGFSYAGCSAKCVARKAGCESEIIYDKSADWSKRQYDAAKPWVQEKTDQTKQLIKDAPQHTEYTYPSDDKKK